MAERLRAEPLLPAGEAKAGKAFGLTGRSLLIAFAFVLLFAYITPYNDYDLANTFIAGNLLPTSSMVVLLLCVFIANPLLRRFAPRFALRSEELAAIWAIIVIASGIPAAGLWRYIIPQLPNLFLPRFGSQPLGRIANPSRTGMACGYGQGSGEGIL
jgi:hypothetical protein